MSALFLPPTVIVAPDVDGYLAYDLSRNRLYRLNATAALVLELVCAGSGVDDLSSAMEPALGANAWATCRAWIDEAVGSGLLSLRNDDAHSELDVARLVQAGAQLRARDRVLAAYVCLRRAAELAPDDPAISCELGELAHIVGRRDVAREAYTRYAEAFPDDAEVAHLLVSLRDEAPPARVPDRAIHQLYARFAGFYEENMVDDLDYRAPALVASAIGRAIGSRTDLSVLDLGCGSGLSGGPVRRQAARMVGVDLSPDMVDRARATDVYDALHVAEITAFLSQPPQSFDVVMSCDALIYFGDLRQVLVPAARWLAPGGVVAFTVERGETAPYRLTDSGRFAHHEVHVEDAVREAGLDVELLETAELRWEYGEPVVGLVVVCRRSSSLFPITNSFS